MEATKAGPPNCSAEQLHRLPRSALAKDERHIDRFGRVFGRVFKSAIPGGAETPEEIWFEFPEEWPRGLAEKFLPRPERMWDRTQSIRMPNEPMDRRMYPLALGGLDEAIRELSRRSSAIVAPGHVQLALDAFMDFPRIGGRPFARRRRSGEFGPRNLSALHWARLCYGPAA